MRLRNVDIYVTGSNSRLLSQDVMTAFRGRGDQVQVFPLSFKEYYDYVGGDKSEAYENYALYGGMPQLISSIGSLTNAKKIADTLGTVKNIKVSTSTIAKYLEYLIESFLFNEAKRYDVKGKKYFEYPIK